MKLPRGHYEDTIYVKNLSLQPVQCNMAIKMSFYGGFFDLINCVFITKSSVNAEIAIAHKLKI